MSISAMGIISMEPLQPSQPGEVGSASNALFSGRVSASGAEGPVRATLQAQSKGGCGCGSCLTKTDVFQSRSEALSAQKQLDSEQHDKMIAETWVHENAHASVAASYGVLAGSPSVNADGSGQTPVSTPQATEGMSVAQLEKIKRQQEGVQLAAMAPEKPSGPDFAIAASGASAESATEGLIQQAKAQEGSSGNTGQSSPPGQKPGRSLESEFAGLPKSAFSLPENATNAIIPTRSFKKASSNVTTGNPFERSTQNQLVASGFNTLQQQNPFSATDPRKEKWKPPVII